VRFIVGFGPGGATDTFTRILSGPLSQALGQTVIVENIAGASGYIGWRTVASATPDGYTLMMAENALVIRPGFKDIKPAFDPSTEFEPIAFVATSPLAICVSNAVPANNMNELVALSHSSTAKKLTNASAGVTSVSQLVWEVIRDATKLDVLDVPYRGGGPAMADLIAGHVDINVASSQVAKPLIEAKQIKCLAVTSKKRSPALPNVPTLEESGIKHADVDLRFWFSVFGPKGMSADVRAKVQTAIQAALADPVLSERLKGLDITPEYGGASVLKARVLSDVKNWTAFIDANGLKGQ
jgi:tripartite-type tricarboxylate transporter receptor subunit TctC